MAVFCFEKPYLNLPGGKKKIQNEVIIIIFN
jgi:hypothetical protein